MSFVRRLATFRIRYGSQCRAISMKEMAKTHGIYFGLYYWITNEILVVALTYFLYYDYFGKDVIANIVDRISPSFWKIDLHHMGETNWSFFGGRINISPKLVGDFTFASVVLSLFTPLQIPVCAATYPWLRRNWIRLFSKRKVCALKEQNIA